MMPSLARIVASGNGIAANAADRMMTQRLLLAARTPPFNGAPRHPSRRKTTLLPFYSDSVTIRLRIAPDGEQPSRVVAVGTGP
jgi:hypothetical protein